MADEVDDQNIWKAVWRNKGKNITYDSSLYAFGKERYSSLY
jgi:hypothetical protein